MLALGVDCKPKLYRETFQNLRNLIYLKCGISFSDNKIYLLESRLSRRLEEKNLKTFEDYYYYLTYDPQREIEIRNLLSCVVTNETSFFRDPAQLESFSKGVVPKVLERKSRDGGRALRLWSAACSTGEEPYTLAMMLMNENVNAKAAVEVIGSDISDNALRSAERAVYDRYSVRNTPEEYMRRYFVEKGEGYEVRKNVRDAVRLRKINLIDPVETRAVKDADVVFLRNVLIYFDDASRKKAVGHIYDSLIKGGYLIVGFSETLHNITRLFSPVRIENSLVYQKL